MTGLRTTRPRAGRRHVRAPVRDREPERQRGRHGRGRAGGARGDRPRRDRGRHGGGDRRGVREPAGARSRPARHAHRDAVRPHRHRAAHRPGRGGAGRRRVSQPPRRDPRRRRQGRRGRDPGGRAALGGLGCTLRLRARLHDRRGGRAARCARVRHRPARGRVRLRARPRRADRPHGGGRADLLRRSCRVPGALRTRGHPAGGRAQRDRRRGEGGRGACASAGSTTRRRRTSG